MRVEERSALLPRAGTPKPRTDRRSDRRMQRAGNAPPAEMPEFVESETDLAPRQIGRLEALVERMLDVVVAVTALLVLAPLIALIALIVKLDSPGPIFYRQLRVGLDNRRDPLSRRSAGRRSDDLGGKPFLIYKFRTMRIDAETKTGPVWATTGDARATRAGRWLRRYRLDEIPQFWNVLRGDMAIVGPRPERPKFVKSLRHQISGYRMRNRVLPGITGWAQVNQGADNSVDDVRQKVSYDLEYVRQRSIWLDVWIMLRTLRAVFEQSDDCSKP